MEQNSQGVLEWEEEENTCGHSVKRVRVFRLKAGNPRAAASIYSNKNNTERLHEAGHGGAWL